MSTCYCTGRCMNGGSCAAFPHGRRLSIDWPVGKVEPVYLTEEDVRRIFREELGRLREELAR